MLRDLAVSPKAASRASLLVMIAGCSTPPVPVEPQPPASVTALAPASYPPLVEATNVRLPAGVSPISYRLQLSIDPREARFSGHVEIAAAIDAPTRTIVLHGRDLDVSRAVVTADSVAPIEARTARRRALGQKDGEDELVLLLPAEVPKGTARIEIDYEASFGSLWGLFRVEAEGRAYAFTQLEAIEGRRMFPSFDEPGFKTPFEIVIDAPTGMVALSNAPVAKVEPRGETTRTSFEKTRPLPTYLVAVAVGPLDVADGPKTPAPLRLVTTKDRARLGMESRDVSAKALAALETYFARPYPYGKLDIVAIPDFGVGAMENAGLVTFREDLLLSDGRAPASARRRMRYVIAHEFAHQWFGDLVTMRWWDDIWLNEGFATWMQSKACDAAFPGFGAIEERVLDKNVAMNADVLPSSHAVRPTVTLSDQIYEVGGWSAYQKGASVLAMLESWVGEEEFRSAINAYVTSHVDGSVTSSELFAALDRFAKKPVSKIASSFLDQPGVPLVDVKVDCAAGPTASARITLTQSELTSAGKSVSDARKKWSVPVCMRVDGDSAPRCNVLEDTATVELARCPKWVEPNAGETGYYRYALAPDWVGRLTKAKADLAPRERAGLVVDGWALSAIGVTPIASTVDVLDGLDLPHETSRVVLQGSIDTLGEMRHALVDDAAMPAFARLVHRLLDPQKARFPLPTSDADEPEETRLTRLLVWSALYDLTDDAKVAAELEPIAKAYASDPTSVDADLGALALRVSARAGGATGLALDAPRLLAAKTPSERVAITIALASKRDPAALRASLDLLLSGEILAGDVRHLKNGVLRNADTIPVFHAWMREHLDAIVKKLGGAGGLTSTIGKTCDAARLAELQAFFEPRLSTLAGAGRAFDEGVADATRCIDLKKRASADLAKRLER